MKLVNTATPVALSNLAHKNMSMRMRSLLKAEALPQVTEFYKKNENAKSDNFQHIAKLCAERIYNHSNSEPMQPATVYHYLTNTKRQNCQRILGEVEGTWTIDTRIDDYIRVAADSSVEDNQK